MAKTKTANVTPIGDRLLVKRLSADEVTKGGIILPDTAQEKSKEGMVIALGQGRRLESGTRVPFTVKVNDKVLFSAYAGTEVQIEGEEYLILGEDEVLAVVE
jgi:chaperonin GroES